MELTLIRKYNALGTNGSIFIGADFIFNTIELPWKENQKSISCIPEGRYKIEKRYNAKFKWHFILNDVLNRSYILIHPANDALKELRGCIAPVSFIKGIGKGYGSRKALDKLISIVFPVIDKKITIYLTITSENNKV